MVGRAARSGAREVRYLHAIVIVTLAAHLAQAQPAQTADDYHRAGEAAYKASDFMAAVSAFEQAYRMNARPQTLFSLAQAYRHLYVEHHDPSVLLRAVELYREYLLRVPRGGRSADAHELLANLDPLAQLVTRENPDAHATPVVAKTQLLVWSSIAGAHARIDGSQPLELPHVTEAAPGPHAIVLSAPGHADARLQITAVENQLVAVEGRLPILPSLLSIVTSSNARLLIDGAPRALSSDAVSLAPGSHRVWVGARGRVAEERVISLAPGATSRLDIPLAVSPRRTRARILYVAAATFAVSGLAAYGYARHRADDGRALYAELDHRAWSTDEYATYAGDREAVDRWQTVGTGLVVTSALVGALATWWWFDDVPTPSRR